MYNKTSRNERFDSYKPLLTGLIVSVLSTMSALLIFSALLTFRDIPPVILPVLSGVAIALGGFLGGLFAARKAGKNGLFFGIITGAALFLILLIASLLISTGGLTVMTLIKLAISVLSSAIGGIIGVNLKNRRKII